MGKEKSEIPSENMFDASIPISENNYSSLVNEVKERVDGGMEKRLAIDLSLSRLRGQMSSGDLNKIERSLRINFGLPHKTIYEKKSLESDPKIVDEFKGLSEEEIHQKLADSDD